MEIPTDIEIIKEANSKYDHAMDIRKTDWCGATQLLFEAIEMYEKAYELRLARIPGSPYVANVIYNKANCYKLMYKIVKIDLDIEKAKKYFQEAINLRIECGDCDSIALSQIKGNFGECLLLEGNIKDATPYLYDNYKKHMLKLGPEHKDTIIASDMYEAAGIESEFQQIFQAHLDSLNGEDQG